MNQLNGAYYMFVDHDQTLYISEYLNHRIMEWKPGALAGRVVAGGNGRGNRLDQLCYPAGVIVDKERKSIIICDYTNERLVRWSHEDGKTGEVLCRVRCWSLTMDLDGFLYVADLCGHAVRRYRIGDIEGIVVAGGNGQGDRLDQLNCPRDLFVDRDHSVYIADSNNHRIMKWIPGAKQGIVVAGGHGPGSSLRQLNNPFGVVVDQWGTLYVADSKNHRIMCWTQGAEQGIVIIGGNGSGNRSYQFNNPLALSLDRDGNLYVCDNGNFRIQKFENDPTG